MRLFSGGLLLLRQGPPLSRRLQHYRVDRSATCPGTSSTVQSIPIQKEGFDEGTIVDQFLLYSLLLITYIRIEVSRAMMTGQRVGVGHDGGRGAAYVENWLKVLRRSRARFTTRRARRRRYPITSWPRCGRDPPKRKRCRGSWRRNSPTKPGRRSATHPVPKRKRKYRNTTGMLA